MLPLRLEIRNFLAYRSPDALRFDGIHLACLTGANGAGKSSLLDAITWALWGEARAKRDEDLIHLGQMDMHVQLDFEQEGIIYRVLRQRTRKGRVGKLELFSMLEQQLTTLTEPSIRETQDKINRLLRLDYDTFTSSAFLQQGKADAFTTRPPNQRKQILSDILGLGQWEHYEEAAKADLKAIENELQVIETRIRDIDEELTKEPGLRKTLTEAEAAQHDAQQRLQEAEARQQELAHVAGDLRAVQARRADSERRLREREHDLKEVEREIHRQQGRLSEFEVVIQRREEIEQGYAALQAAREADSALTDKLKQLRDSDQRKVELEGQLREARAELEREISGYQAQMTELERTVASADEDDLHEAQIEMSALQSAEEQRNQTQQQMNALNEERARLDSLLKTLGDEGKKLNSRIDQLQATESATCPLCGQDLTEPHRLEVIAQLETERDEKRELYRQTQTGIKSLKEQTSQQQQHIEGLEADLKKLKPLMERVGLLQAQMDNALAARSRGSEVQARLEAVQTILESEGYGQEIRDQLARLEDERSAIGYDSSSHDAAQTQLNAYRRYEAEQTTLQVALTGLPDMQLALEGARLRQEKITTALNEERVQIETAVREIEQLKALEAEYLKREQEVNLLRTMERQQYQRLVNARQELDTLDKQRQRKAELETRREQRRHAEGLVKELVLAFGKKGVPAMMIEAAIPELEEIANLLLARMTDGRMNLRFNTQRDKVSGEGVIETLDIDIADELGTRSYELYSGGEAFRINFAIRVALSQLLARRAGAQLRTLFIDEGFGTQDEDGRNKLVEAITAIQDEFDLILVITHIDDLRDSFPVHVMVEKTSSGSRVSVR